MALKKVQLPDNSTQDINDSRIASADITKWNAIENFVFVQGSSSAAGNGASGEYLSTKWEGTVSGVTTPTNGMKIAYRVATNAGVSTAGAVLSIDGGTTYKPVVFNVNSVIGTRYSVGSTLLMTYNSTQTATAYLTSNTKTTVTGCWQVMDYSASNTDTKVRQYQSGANAAGTSPEYPLLSRYGTTNVDSSYEANYARFHTGATLNTTTGGITAASFKKTGGTSSQFLKADGSVDNNTYLTTAPVTSVNGSTGDVTITVPTKVSELTNDSGFVTDVSGKEDKSNKVTSLSSSSTDDEYPSAKTVYDAIKSFVVMGVGTYYQAYTYANTNTGAFMWILNDSTTGTTIVKPIWHTGNHQFIDAAGAVVRIGSATAPTFSISTGSVAANTTVTITPSTNATLYYKVGSAAYQSSATAVTVTITEDVTISAYCEYLGAVSETITNTYTVVVPQFVFRVKLTADNQTVYVPISGNNGSSYDMTVDWGDNSAVTTYQGYGSSKGLGHAYSGVTGDIFTITLRGDRIDSLVFANETLCNRDNLYAIDQNTLTCDTFFGNYLPNGGADSAPGFKQAANLTYISADALQNNKSQYLNFQETALSSFPAGLFASQTQGVIFFSGMFQGLTATISATNIAELEDIMGAVTNFNSMFYDFRGTCTLPDDFFDNAPSGITSVWGMIWAYQATVAGDAKALYDSLLPKMASGANTSYALGGQNLTNRNQVPTTWGGTMSV